MQPRQSEPQTHKSKPKLLTTGISRKGTPKTETRLNRLRQRSYVELNKRKGPTSIRVNIQEHEQLRPK